MSGTLILTVIFVLVLAGAGVVAIVATPESDVSLETTPRRTRKY